jgi:signal transduction histidine kinase/HAMP domain-containing protein
VRLGIKGKQVLGVSSIVATVVVVLSLLHLARLASVSLAESKARADLLADAIFDRAFMVVRNGADPDVTRHYEALRDDQAVRSILKASFYSKNVTFAAIADLDNIAVVHADPALEGLALPPGDELTAVLSRSPFSQLLAVYSGQGRNLELRRPLLLGAEEFGSIRVGVSTLLIRADLSDSLKPAITAALLALAVAVVAAMLLAQLVLRPIHVIRSGLTRLGQGELGVRVDLSQTDEFGELGTFFNNISEQISADRSQMAGQVANLESAVEHLEDAVAIVSPGGELLFVNPAMRTLVPGASVGATLDDLVTADHPLRRLSEQSLVSGQSRGPVQATLAAQPGGEATERLMMSHTITGKHGDLVGIMLVVRNLEYLSQVQSTIRYSRKLAALGRLSAGVAHEVKNPLNAMMIHLELLRHQFMPSSAARASARRGAGSAASAATVARPVDASQAIQHVDIIAGEIRRLDAVVQEFLKFSRPEDLKLQPVRLSALFDEILPIVKPEADHAGVQVLVEHDGVPDVNGDPTMLRQAFLNIALNACQAMPNGGILRIQCESVRGRRVSVSFVDTGVGIRPDHLQRIFDLYFTTKEKGSGIGLSMVYRTVQMHDGEIEVQSTPGAGTTFRVLLPQA